MTMVEWLKWQIKRLRGIPPIQTAVPGRPPIPLVAYYHELLSYYPNCEMATKRWFVQNAREDWVFFDCGANVGYYALLFSSLAPKGRVYAFEPTKTHAMLLRNLRHNGAVNVVAERLALGRVGGRTAARLPRIWGHAWEGGEFEFTTLDDYVRNRGIGHVDCIKIDVDSHEFAVLMGAEETLSRFRPRLVIELTDIALTLRGVFSTEVFAWLAAHGYSRATVLDHTNYVFGNAGLTTRGDQAPSSLTLDFEPPFAP